jgi:hypothetical protein
MVFERHIVYPNGHREVEGATPKQLPAPDATQLLPNLNPIGESDEQGRRS